MNKEQFGDDATNAAAPETGMAPKKSKRKKREKPAKDPASATSKFRGRVASLTLQAAGDDSAECIVKIDGKGKAGQAFRLTPGHAQRFNAMLAVLSAALASDHKISVIAESAGQDIPVIAALELHR